MEDDTPRKKMNPKARMHKFKIGIVDDEVDFLEVLQMFFEDDPTYAAFEMKFYSSPVKCLADVKNLDYILTDINMPFMNGYQLIAEAKMINPGLQFSMMSAYNDETNRDKARQMGASSYFVKPLDFDLIRLHLYSTFNINS